ncbi:MAG: FkbM family methyltransferase, partial [Bdellovibrionales bacterium]|nr:FkbM family methyltransferase [Bdellovibrionales bacterium]
YRLNHEISFHPIALGDREGTVSIGFPERHTGGSGVSLHQNSCAQLHDKVELQQITVKRLDDIIDTNVDLMKIDCEGSELEILRGAERILKNHNIRIVLEWAPGFHSPPLSGGEMYDQVVTANNFIARRLTPNQQLEPFNRDDAIQTAHCDILLLRQNKAA